jgi:hypothetical protein
MRNLLSLPLLALLGACAGNVADYVGPRSSIVSPQLIRYGLPMDQTRCVAGRVGTSINPLWARRLMRAARTVRRGSGDAGRLAPRDLVFVAGTVANPEVKAELARAYDACGVTAATAASEAAAVPEMPATGTVAAAVLPHSPAWLNLGAAASGQSIAIDATSIEQAPSHRSAWFRLTEPGSAIPGQNTYLLRVDCSTRTISEKARRKPDGTGATVEVPGDDKPVPIERGTVMEIALLALCT